MCLIYVFRRILFPVLCYTAFISFYLLYLTARRTKQLNYPVVGDSYPKVTPTLTSTSDSPKTLDVPFTLSYRGNHVHATFTLDSGCEPDMVISQAIADALKLDATNIVEEVVVGVGGVMTPQKKFNGTLQISYTTGRGSTRTTNCTDFFIVDADERLVGIPVMTRLRMTVPAPGKICIFPFRTRKIV